MDINATNGPLAQTEADWLIVGYGTIDSAESLTTPLLELDTALDGAIHRLATSGDITGKLGETHLLADVPGLSASRLLLVGLGTTSELTSRKLEKALVTATRRISKKTSVSDSRYTAPEPVQLIFGTSMRCSVTKGVDRPRIKGEV